MKKLDSILSKFEDVLCVTGLLGATFLMFINVVMRHFFNAGFPWSEELIRFMIIWVTFFGVSLCARKEAHVAIDFFLYFMSKRMQRLLLIVVNIISILFCIVMTYYGTQLVLQTLASQQLAPALQLPLYIVYLCLPIGFILAALRFTQKTVGLILTGARGEVV